MIKAPIIKITFTLAKIYFVKVKNEDFVFSLPF